MAYVERDEEVIVVQSAYHEKDLVKSIPGSRWDAVGKSWYLPLSWASCKALRGVFQDRLQIGPGLAEWSRHEYQMRVAPSMAMRTITDYAVAYHPSMYGFQNAGVAWLALANQGLLGDDMGVGKTAQLIVATRTNEMNDAKPPAFPVLVICPNSIKENWKREWVGPLPSPAPSDGWDEWGVHTEVFVIHGGAATRRKQFVEVEKAIDEGLDVIVIINIEAVRLHSRLAPYGSVSLKKCMHHGGEDPKVDDLRCEVHLKELNRIPFKTVIVDEAHRMKEPKSKQTRAIWAIQHADSVEYRYSATGTPIANHVGELWSLMHGVAPEDFPVKTKFLDRYALQSWNPFGGLDITGVRPDTRDEFFGFFDPRYRRMSKQLVLPNLPPKVRQTRYVEMKPKQKKAYNEMHERMATRLEDDSVVISTNNLARNTRLMQFASAYAYVNEEGDVRLSEPSPKLDTMMEIIEDMGGRPIVIAAQSRQLIELAAARLEAKKIEHRLVTGRVTGPERDRAIDDFQAGRAQVMLLTVAAGGVGITLTAADTIVFLQRSWRMIDNRQAEDRVHRIGSGRHESIVIIDMITKNTIEEEQIPKLQEKLRRLQELQRDIEVARANGELEIVAKLEAEENAIDQSPIWATGDKTDGSSLSDEVIADALNMAGLVG